MYPIEKYQFKTYEQKNEDGTTSTVVIALSTYANRVVKGVAKCTHDDKFDLEKGKKLAAARCDLKVCQKRRKRALQKCSEAMEKVNESLDYSRRMSNYYSDTYTELIESEHRLSEIEKALK